MLGFENSEISRYIYPIRLILVSICIVVFKIVHICTRTRYITTFAILQMYENCWVGLLLSNTNTIQEYRKKMFSFLMFTYIKRVYNICGTCGGRQEPKCFQIIFQSINWWDQIRHNNVINSKLEFVEILIFFNLKN